MLLRCLAHAQNNPSANKRKSAVRIATTNVRLAAALKTHAAEAPLSLLTLSCSLRAMAQAWLLLTDPSMTRAMFIFRASFNFVTFIRGGPKKLCVFSGFKGHQPLPS